MPQPPRACGSWPPKPSPSPASCPTCAGARCARRWRCSPRWACASSSPAAGASGSRRRYPAGACTGARSLASGCGGAARARVTRIDMPREVRVSVLLAALSDRRVVAPPRRAVTGLTADSRRVTRGDAFVAVPGFKQDARRFVPEAVGRGAALVVTEGGPVADVPVPQVIVPSARRALAALAGAYWDHPSRALTLVGITGTNGKTTTSYLVDALLRVRGGATGILGTIQYVVGDEIRPAGQTTPEALEIEAMLAAMRERGVRGVAMEVSSHALALSRVDALAFDVGVFTNLTQDHLDFHGTLEEYGRAKRRLFELLAASPKPRRVAVVNGDDPAAARMVAGLGLETLTYGLGPDNRVRASEWTSTLDGVRLTVGTPAGRLGLASPRAGEHNVMNLLGRPRVNHRGQPTLGESRRDHRGDRRRRRAGLARARPLCAARRPACGDHRRARVGGARRHGGHRRQGARDVPDRRDRRAAVRRPRRRAAAAVGAGALGGAWRRSASRSLSAPPRARWLAENSASPWP